MLTGLGRWVLPREMSQPPRRGSLERGDDWSAKRESVWTRGCWQRAPLCHLPTGEHLGTQSSGLQW